MIIYLLTLQYITAITYMLQLFSYSFMVVLYSTYFNSHCRASFIMLPCL